MKPRDKAVQERVKKALAKIREKPELGKPLQGELHGMFAERVGGVRVIYTYDEKSVVVRRCRDRKDGY